MKEQLEHRLKELKEELERGQNILNEHDAKRQNMMDSLLRISGAVQVLQEELSKHNSETQV